MNPQEIVALISTGQILVGLSISTIDQFRSFVSTLRPGLTDAQLNVICDGIIAGATAHKAVADADRS